MGEHCPELKDIHFGQCYNVSDEGLIALAKGCPKLQRIYMQENKLVGVFLCSNINYYSSFVLSQCVCFKYVVNFKRNVQGCMWMLWYGWRKLSKEFVVER